jgi:ectoine hydroxylase-related dioxygenase (phytanoyl-CoA dioxygenase family)
MALTDAQWAQYQREGYLVLGKVLSDERLKALQDRIDAIMLGDADIDYSKVLMQLDSTTGKYEDAPEQTMGHKGRSLAYRKIQNLEHDRVFRDYIEADVYRELCARVYGEDTPIACFRAMFMNKPAQQGTLLPWHQDAWVYLDRQPEITVWTALDPATKANGCVQVIPGSHLLGRVNQEHHSGFLTQEQVEKYCREEDSVYVELEAGEAVVFHNWLMHRSDVNRTDSSRRGFSVCYMDARTIASNGETFTPLFDRVPA